MRRRGFFHACHMKLALRGEEEYRVVRFARFFILLALRCVELFISD